MGSQLTQQQSRSGGGIEPTGFGLSVEGSDGLIEQRSHLLSGNTK
jgi:hypothetical protein